MRMWMIQGSKQPSHSEVCMRQSYIISLICINDLWDVIVQDTHVLERMFAASRNGWMNVYVLPL
jgi:hypothetical protein